MKRVDDGSGKPYIVSEYLKDHVKTTVVPCPECNEPLSHCGGFETCVGYSSPEGHDHNDNCWVREYFCKNGHIFGIALRRSCPACDWKGKEYCACCMPGEKKVDAWPEEKI